MERQQAIETNRSIRNIKNELESLLGKGVIQDDTFDNITSLLPSEKPLVNGAQNNYTQPASEAVRTASIAHIAPPQQATPAPSVSPVVNAPVAAPPSYNNTPAPALPIRQTPVQTPVRPVLVHARALYRYAGADSRDLPLEKEDMVAVLEYTNDDWWFGVNTRTQKEGIFPKTYVLVQDFKEGQTAWPAPQQQVVQQDAYASSTPPMAVAQEGEKKDNMGKKFGKKLGNAAIFGAGATIGGNIVNSIF